VQYVRAGTAPPPASTCDYWFSQSYRQPHLQYLDYLPEEDHSVYGSIWLEQEKQRRGSRQQEQHGSRQHVQGRSEEPGNGAGYTPAGTSRAAGAAVGNGATEDQRPLKRARQEAAAAERAEPAAAAGEVQGGAGGQQQLRLLELFCGAGGLSYLAQECTKGTQIVCR
jgi:hypothetical protein